MKGSAVIYVFVTDYSLTSLAAAQKSLPSAQCPPLQDQIVDECLLT